MQKSNTFLNIALLLQLICPFPFPFSLYIYIYIYIYIHFVFFDERETLCESLIAFMPLVLLFFYSLLPLSSSYLFMEFHAMKFSSLVSFFFIEIKILFPLYHRPPFLSLVQAQEHLDNLNMIHVDLGLLSIYYQFHFLTIYFPIFISKFTIISLFLYI
jgi:hypothetical protein